MWTSINGLFPLKLIFKSESFPNTACTLSPNFKLLSDLSNTILLVFAVWKVTSSPKFDVELTSSAPANVETPAILTLSKFVCPSTSISPPISKLPNVPTPTAETPAPT